MILLTEVAGVVYSFEVLFENYLVLHLLILLSEFLNRVYLLKKILSADGVYGGTHLTDDTER
jgi:hypothetical protein